MQKRVIAVHDISCVGKCSLTVALPILSACGIECSVLPTAVLSTHTGGFTGYTFRDLTDDLEPIIKHWQSLGLHADAIYTGYLGSFRQLDIVNMLFDTLGKDAIKLVDPVMADNGVLYKGFDMDFAAGMRDLCKKADIVIPNITEASLMLGEECIYESKDQNYWHKLIDGMLSLGPKACVLTGTMRDNDTIGATYGAEGKYGDCIKNRIDGYYHGTGDVFGSAFLGAYLNGKSVAESVNAAVTYTTAAIERTFKAGTDRKYGVDFEGALPVLLELIK